MKKDNVCYECGATILHPAEYHIYEYCVLAKAFPNDWRNMVKKIIKNGHKFQTDIITGERYSK